MFDRLGSTIRGTACTAAVLFCAAPHGAAPDEFERTFAAADEKSRSGAGAAYDRELGRYFESLPAFKARLDICLGANPGRHAVKGYFLFARSGTYRLILRPEGKFARCLSSALEGQSVPKPPRLPYANPFRYANAP